MGDFAFIFYRILLPRIDLHREKKNLKRFNSFILLITLWVLSNVVTTINIYQVSLLPHLPSVDVKVPTIIFLGGGRGADKIDPFCSPVHLVLIVPTLLVFPCDGNVML